MKNALGTIARPFFVALTTLALAACGGGSGPDDVGPSVDVDGSETATTCQVDDDCKAETGGNPCLKATCDREAGLCFTNADPAAEGVACDDGDACTSDDACHAGECGGQAKACDDANDCTADGCDPGSGTCTHDDLPNGESCDDGDECTSGDKCQAGVCNAGSNTCACQVDADCDEWEDGDLCNGTLVCGADHTCQLDEATVITCDPAGDTDCEKNQCAPATGECAVVAVNEGGACQPADPCLEGGQCSEGACAGGTARTCDDGDPCTVDACEAATGVCEHPAANAGSACDDGVSCTHGEACDAGGHCVPATVDACDDGDPCTDDACDTLLGGCAHVTTSPGTACDDGDACSTGDVCNAAHQCAGTGFVTCDDDDLCTANACDSATGDCSFPLKPEGSPCDDGDLCTTPDACDEGGACQPGAPKTCNDGKVCTADACDPETGACVFTPLADGAPCTDNDACTTGDACDDQGACVPGVDLLLRSVGEGGCDDGEECTTDTCDHASGACGSTPLAAGVPCSDGDACTAGDACDEQGACVPGVELAHRSLGEGGCDDGEECTEDSCNPATGACSNDPVDDGVACDDGDGCTLYDGCQAGACQLSTPKDCDDHEECTVDSCRSSDGLCLHDGAPQDGVACTHVDTCLRDTVCGGGACGGGEPIAECCHEQADCDTGEDCQTWACVNEQCQYAAEVCSGESAGCTMKLCGVGAGCEGTAVSLAGRVVLSERRFADEGGSVSVRSDPVGGFAVNDQGLALAGVDDATLLLKPLRLPRGTTTLRVRAHAPTVPTEPDALTLVDLDAKMPVAGRVVDLEAGGLFEVVYAVSANVDRTVRYGLRVDDATWTLEGVQAVHHGGQGCPSALGPEAVEWLDTAGNALQVTSCANAEGAKLVVWTETATKTRLAWRLWDGQWWSEEKTAGGEVDPQPEFSLGCVAHGGGWAIAFGAVLDSGFVASRLLLLGANGAATSNGFVSLATGDHSETPALAALPNGDLLVAFTSDLIDGDGTGIALARYAPDGQPVGAANVQVNQITNGTQRRPTLAVSGARVLVAWESKLGANKVQLARRLFDLDLVATTDEATFTDSNAIEYLRPSAAPLAGQGSDFLVAYEAVGRPGNAGTGVVFSAFTSTGTESENELDLTFEKANDQLRPVVFAVPGGALVQWRSDHSTQYVFDLMAARFDALGLQGNARVVAGNVTSIGAALPAAPGALEHAFVKDGKVGLARLGLACDKGLFDCDLPEVGVCADADVYLPLVEGCLGLSCSGVCP